MHVAVRHASFDVPRHYLCTTDILQPAVRHVLLICCSPLEAPPSWCCDANTPNIYTPTIALLISGFIGQTVHTDIQEQDSPAIALLISGFIGQTVHTDIQEHDAQTIALLISGFIGQTIHTDIQGHDAQTIALLV